MNPEHAKAAADMLAGLWEGESAATVQVLAAVKDETRDYRPDPKSRSAWELAVHLATADVWFIDSIVKGTFAFDPAVAKAAEGQFTSASELAEFYRTTFPRKVKELQAIPAAALTEPLDFFGVFQWPRVQFIGFANNHSVHHRGQLAAYLRAMGSKVPNIYGPSADAEPMQA